MKAASIPLAIYEILIYRIAADGVSGRQLLREHALEVGARDDRGHIQAAFVQRIQQSTDYFGPRQVRAGLAADRRRQSIEIQHLALEHDDRDLRPGLAMQAWTTAPGAWTIRGAAGGARRH